MGLIYVNPEGPNGNPDPLAAAKDIRETFARMAMNDEETVALIVGGHSFGKCHGAASADYVGPEPEACPVRGPGPRLAEHVRQRRRRRHRDERSRRRVDQPPVQWDNGFLDNLFAYEWELTTSPAGAHQWTPKEAAAQGTVPDAHDPSKSHAPMMLTTDLALRLDPIYGPIAQRFHEHPDELADAFARAWFKLTHRDMGPVSRYLGPLVPSEQLIWQDPVPAVDHELIGDADITALKARLLDCGLSTSQLVATAWASAASFRGTDKRGGANGARIRLAPQKDWAVNEPAELATALRALEGDATRLQRRAVGREAGVARRPDRARRVRRDRAGREGRGLAVTVPFAPGRTDATPEQTDAESFAVLEPTADGFRNYLRAGEKLPPETLLLDRANLLTLTAPEMTVLVGGLRALDANTGHSPHGVFTDRPGALTNDFFVNLLDSDTEWKASVGGERVRGRDRRAATQVDSHRCRPRLRLELAAPRDRGGLRK